MKYHNSNQNDGIIYNEWAWQQSVNINESIKTYIEHRNWIFNFVSSNKFSIKLKYVRHKEIYFFE